MADTVYGGNEDLRAFLEAHGYSFVLAVACDEPVEVQTPEGLKRMTVTEAEASFCHEEKWQRLSMSQGTKGPRLFDWAVMPMLSRCADDGRHFLLIRRCVDDPSEKAYYFVFAPLGTTLVEMVMLVQACLAGICAAASVSSAERITDAETSPLLPLTIPEVRHLLACLLWPLPRSPTLLLSWSWWRRCHQRRASYSHTQRRTTRK